MAKKGGGGKGQEETPLQVLERIAAKKFFSYGIPVHKQYMQRIAAYVEEDSEFEQLHIWDEAGPNAIKAMMDGIRDAG
jgi:hypothetical protein